MFLRPPEEMAREVLNTITVLQFLRILAHLSIRLIEGRGTLY